MPEVGLGIGRSLSNSGGLQREVLYWYDERGARYQTPEEVSQQAQQQAKAECRQRELAQQQAAELTDTKLHSNV